MKVTKETEKGITLIALIITIILLLILAGITITQLTGSGLFGKAKMAKIYSREAEAEEQLSIEILRVQTDKEGICTIQEIYDDFSSIKNEKIDVIQVNTDESHNNIIREIIVVVKGYEEFSFTVGEALNIKEICEISKNDWKGETLEDIYSNLENSLSININNEKLTEGTTVNVNVKQPSKIKKVQILIGDVIVYSEENLNKNIYLRTVNINEMQSIENLKFKQSYTTKVKVTVSNGDIIEKNGTDVINYTIGNAESLKELGNQVNGGEKFEGETILQIADIDLSSVCNPTVGTWEPIGVAAISSTWFDGTYNGNKKNITNLYINNNADISIGLFGFVGFSGTIKNIILYGEVVQNSKADRVVGAIVGRNEGIIENCVNYANVNNHYYYYAAGIAGGNCNTVRNCINNGNINGSQYIGGISSLNNNTIVSNSNSKIEKVIISNCINNGAISGETYVGGIIGELMKGNLELCSNNGNVIALSSIAGGIAGKATDADILSCKNTGNITSNGNPSNREETSGTGGIAGRSTANITCSSNEGNITSKGYFTGGILGYGNEENTVIEQCYNKGNVKSEQNAVGGIAGCNIKRISNCYNYLDSDKTISGVYNISGIVGVSFNVAPIIENCYNIGENIIGTLNSNAAILASSYINDIKIDNCYYLDTSILNAIGPEVTGTLLVNNIFRKSLDNFKLPSNNSSSITYLLNRNSSSGVWGQNQEINDGLPYLVNNY